MPPAERDAFEKAIREGPWDEATRRVFADWLEEHGFDEEAAVQRKWTPERMREAERVLGEFARVCHHEGDHDFRHLEEPRYTVAGLVEAMKRYLIAGELVGCGYYFPDEEEIQACWEAFETWTGIPISTEVRQKEFACCCL